jgi:putative GTP pyrophosphokinase
MYEGKIKDKEAVYLEQFFSMLEESNGELDWSDKIKEFQKLMAYYKCAMMEIETKFNVLNQQFSLMHDRNPISSIKCRIKSPDSIINKLKLRNFPRSLESIENNINDVAGVRVVCSFVRDVYMLADALLSQDDISVIEIKDYIKNPKKNGYRSLHVIVAVPIFLVNEKRLMNVEIQLRTIAMDSWASLEHQLKYKKDMIFTDDMEKELQNCASFSFEFDKKMDELREKVGL